MESFWRHEFIEKHRHFVAHEKGINWNDLELKWKNGQFIEKNDGVWTVIPSPIFTQSRDAVEKYLVNEVEREL